MTTVGDDQDATMAPGTGLGPDVTRTGSGWLADDELREVRDRVPIVYVEALPVRVDHLGRTTRIGLLLRAMPDGTIGRALVAGRVLRGETLRDALWRHCTKDLGPDCDPQLPLAPQPVTVAEYFPDPDRTGFHDPRQHAVSLVYAVPINGDVEPSQDSLQFSWMTVAEATHPSVGGEMSSGHDRLLRIVLAHTGALP